MTTNEAKTRLGEFLDRAQRLSRDGADDKFIHTALAASASWLVTGDPDLLVIRAKLNLSVSRKRKFLDGLFGG